MKKFHTDFAPVATEGPPTFAVADAELSAINKADDTGVSDYLASRGSQDVANI